MLAVYLPKAMSYLATYGDEIASEAQASGKNILATGDPCVPAQLVGYL